MDGHITPQRNIPELLPPPTLVDIHKTLILCRSVMPIINMKWNIKRMKKIVHGAKPGKKLLQIWTKNDICSTKHVYIGVERKLAICNMLR